MVGRIKPKNMEKLGHDRNSAAAGFLGAPQGHLPHSLSGPVKLAAGIPVVGNSPSLMVFREQFQRGPNNYSNSLILLTSTNDHRIEQKVSYDPSPKG